LVLGSWFLIPGSWFLVPDSEIISRPQDKMKSPVVCIDIQIFLLYTDIGERGFNLQIEEKTVGKLKGMPHTHIQDDTIHQIPHVKESNVRVKKYVSNLKLRIEK